MEEAGHSTLAEQEFCRSPQIKHFMGVDTLFENAAEIIADSDAQISNDQYRD